MSSVDNFGHDLVVTQFARVVLGIFCERFHQVLFLVDGGVVLVEFALDILEHIAAVIGNHEVTWVEFFVSHGSIGFCTLMTANAEVVEKVFGNSLESEVGSVP
jgi:hypothetical protein